MLALAGAKRRVEIGGRDDPSEYWNEDRIGTAGFYQYYVYKTAAELIARTPNCAFLDIGCGYPRKVAELIVPLTDDITLIDQPSMASLLAERFPAMQFLPQNLEALDLELDRQFDCIVCADVIEHLLDPDPLLAFIREALSPEGVAIISTPERDVERGPDCLSSSKPEHVREWNASEFSQYLSSRGFEVTSHPLLPKGRLPWAEELALPLLAPWRSKRHCSCQTAICKRK